MMLSPAVRTSVMRGLQLGVEHLDHAAPFGAGPVPADAEIADQLAKLLQPTQILIIVLGEFDKQNRFRIAAQERIHRRPVHRDVAGEPEHGAVDQLDRDRTELDDILRRRHRLVKAAEMHAPTARRPSCGESFSSILVENASVPSEPTSRCARLMSLRARHQRVEIVAADAALHFGKAPLDLASLARGKREQIAHQGLRHVDA